MESNKKNIRTSNSSEQKNLQKNDQSQQGNKIERLDELFNSIVPNDNNWGNSSFEAESLPGLPSDLTDYPGVTIKTETELKISELKGIATTIERQKIAVQSENAIDFSKYKVQYPQVLNKPQLLAATITDKPMLVIAGAGSGKTRIIVHRVAYLIEQGVDPRSILLLTFTRKAANEMLNRVQELLHNTMASNITGGTFHSFASFILRKYANMLGLPPNFTIVDTADSEDIVDLIRSELKLNTKNKRFPRKGRIYDIISYSRNCQMSISEIINRDYTGLKEFIADIELIFQAYTKYKKLSRIFDFDDLMDVLNTMLKQHTTFRNTVQNTYSHIMVDEFQDTNTVQYEIVSIIANKHRRLMVVGDDSQSIYAFRGANYENILRFPQAFPDVVLIKIEENYRSNQTILDFTNEIMQHASIGYRKQLFTSNNNTVLPIVKRVYGQDDEAVFIVDRILELSEKGVPLNQIAVLNRADWHNRYIQTELSKRGIPYVVVGGFRFSERMHVKDVMAYLKLTYNPADAVSWHRVLKYIGGIGQLTTSKVVAELQQLDEPFSFEGYKTKHFYNDLQKLGDMLAQASHPEHSIIQKLEIIRDYYQPILKAREDDYLQRMEDIVVLLDLSKKYHNLDRFIADFALDPPTKRVADQSTPLIDEGEEQDKLTLTTIHSAKGLEWYTVFVPHALEGLFPSNRATSLEEMEEERRLFYVACSRAKEELYISFPRNIYSYNAFFHLPSRFIIEMNPRYFEFIDT